MLNRPALPWEAYIPGDGEFPVRGYSLNSQLHSVPACQSIIKKAVVERLKAHYGMDQFPETGTKYQIRFSVFKDQVSIGLDASGEGLYKRGYRAVGVEAPLRETLAAALVTLSRYRGRRGPPRIGRSCAAHHLWHDSGRGRPPDRPLGVDAPCGAVWLGQLSGAHA